MEGQPGEGWADMVSKILRTGKVNPESSKILSKARREDDSSDSEPSQSPIPKNIDYKTFRLKPNNQADALLENELKGIATKGVVHLFNAAKTVNPKVDKKRKKKKKKKNKKKKFGFIRFFQRASPKLIDWYGNTCNHNPERIARWASREWEAMDDHERKHFIIRPNSLEEQHSLGNFVKDYDHPYFATRLQGIYSRGNVGKELSNRQNRSNKRHKLSDNNGQLGVMDEMNQVVEKRDLLHKKYDEPVELNKLELILKTYPAKPMKYHHWINKMKSAEFGKIDDTSELSNKVDTSLYDAYVKFDNLRYQSERKAWLSQLLGCELSSTELTIEDFKLKTPRMNFKDLMSTVDANKGLILQDLTLVRPLGAYSLFLRAYRYQIRKERPKFKFGEHLDLVAEAWAKMSEEEKDIYRQESERLKQKYEQRKSELSAIPDWVFSAKKTKYTNGLGHASSPSTLYFEDHPTEQTKRKQVWASISEEEKLPYIQRAEEKKHLIEVERRKISEKLVEIKELVQKSKELHKFKRSLGLIEDETT